jgi:hypothetical protein
VKKLIAAALVVVLLIGGAIVAVPLAEKHAAAQIKADIERDGATTVESVEVGLLARSITLSNLKGRRVGEISIGHWQASGLALPLDELIRGRTPLTGLRLGDPLQASRLAVDGFHMVQDGASWSVGSLVIEDFKLDRYDPILAGPNQFTALGARIISALSMTRLEQKDAAFTDSAKGDRVAFAAMTIGGFDKGQIGSITMAGMELMPKAAKAPLFKIADMSVKNLDLRRVFAAIGMPNWRPGMPVGRVDLDDASLSGFSGEAMTRYGIALGRITSESRREGKDVKHSRMRIEGFVLAPPARNLETLQLRIGLQAMGLKELRLEFDCSGSEDRAKSEVSVDRCALTGPELGEINLSTKLVGADEAFWRAVDEGDSLSLLRTKAGLSGAKLTIVDRGLVERSLKAVATTSGQPLAAVRAGAAQDIRRFQPPGVLITEAMTKLLDTVARFMETGGTLAIEAKPDAPIGIDKIEYFRRPGPDLVNMLGLSATLSR